MILDDGAQFQIRVQIPSFVASKVIATGIQFSEHAPVSFSDAVESIFSDMLLVVVVVGVI